MDRSISWGSVAAKDERPEMETAVDDDPTPTQSRAGQTFFLPEKDSPITPSPVTPQQGPGTSAMETSWFDFDFGFETKPQLPAATLENDSKSSLTSTTTGISGPNNRRFSHGALTVDTSVASSATSMASFDTSIYSAVTNTADIYGWEEELNRRTSVGRRDTSTPKPPMTRRATSGGRITTPRVPSDLYTPPPKRVDLKRKSLLHRVLSMGRGVDEQPNLPTHPSTSGYPTTSA